VPTSNPPWFNLLLTSPALLLKHPQKEMLVESELLSSHTALLQEDAAAAGARKGLAPRTAMARPVRSSSSAGRIFNLVENSKQIGMSTTPM